MKYFNIQMAAQVSGVSTHTIRAWEKRYSALVPDRTSSGRRQYSTQDIERLSLLSQLTALGNTISQIARLPDEELKSIYEQLTKNKESVYSILKSQPQKNVINAEETLQNLLLALSGYKVDIISHELQKARTNLSPKDFALKILNPLIQEVFRRKKNGSFSGGQLHALFAIIKFHAGNIIYNHYERKIKSVKKFTIATPQGELYVLDIMLGALLCSHHNQSFFYLSSNLPSSSIAEASRALEAQIIILGIHQIESLSHPLAQTIEEITSSCLPESEIWIIGAGDHIKSLPIKPKNVKIIGNFEALDFELEKLTK
jgi:DNA-binding transcriptional MerR regulator